MPLFVKWLISTAAILVAAYLIPGVTVAGIWTAIWLVVFLAIINILIKPLLIIITLPINIITLGLFTFVINALLIIFASSIIKGFEVGGFWNALLFSIILSIINYVLNRMTVASHSA